MAKIISRSFLNRNLSGVKLRSKVGNIRVRSDDNDPKDLGGTALKKFIVSKMGGKADTLIEKELKKEYGVSGNQTVKRNKLMQLIRDDKPAVEGRVIKTRGEKSIFMTDEQIGRNIRRNMARDESGIIIRQSADVQYGAGTVRTTYLGAAKDKSVSPSAKLATMADLNLKAKPTGFAQNYDKNKSADKPLPEMPIKGQRPIGL